jgi:flagellar hook-associated protein 1
MGTLGNAWDLTVQALQADQAALNIVSNNVTNSTLQGYTREIPDFVENNPITINGIAYGTGVSVTGATAVRDSVLEMRIAQMTSQTEGTTERLDALDTIQQIFQTATSSGTTSGGTSSDSDLNTDIQDFFDSLSSLESNPTDSSLRSAVLAAANTMAEGFNNVSEGLGTEREGLDNQVSPIVSQINTLTSNIAQLNKEIEQTPPGTDTNVLQDQRQTAIDSLSQLIGVNEITTQDGSVTITTANGDLLVSGSSATQLTTATGSTTGPTDGMTTILDGGKDITADLTSGGGQLGGLLTVRDQDIPSALNAVNTLALNIADAVNAQQQKGEDLNGDATTPPIFSFSTSVAASSITVSLTDGSGIAAAAANSGAGSGDDSNLVLLAGLASGTFVNGQSPANFYSTFISTLGSTISDVQTTNTAQQASLTQIQNQRDSLSSTNLDDEANNLQLYEKAYQSAARVFSILNSILGESINLGSESSTA